MKGVATRPAQLPDFTSPPINEVVLGVQFVTPERYQQILAGEVWALYRKDYPTVEEKEAIAPSFETFGGRPGAQIRFGLVTGAQHDRFWFLSPQKDELIQFQADRLLHNWRKIGDGSNPYPRFEKMVVRFQSELTALEKYFGTLAPQNLNITQCEVTYINHIALDESRNPSAWLRPLNFTEIGEQDAFSFVTRSVVRGAGDAPIGRLTVQAGTSITPEGKEVVQLELTMRGAPKAPKIEEAIRFLSDGRDRIVTKFAEITTAAAHEKWGRVQ
jgi:uncharacterized protein (TIGR04255 family)